MFKRSNVLYDPNSEPTGGNPPAADQTPAPSGIGDTVRVKVNDAWREIPREKAIELISKGYGADEAFRKAADMRKSVEAKSAELQKLERWQGLLDSVKAGGEDSLESARTLMKEFGMPDTADAVLDTFAEDQPQRPALSADQSAALSRASKFFAECEKRGIKPEEALDDLRQYKRYQVTDKAQTAVRETLSKHPVIGRALRGKGSDTIFEDVWNRFQRRVAGGESPTDDTIQKAANEVLAILDAVVPERAATSDLYPDGMGATPIGRTGGSLQPPKMPDMKDYKDDLSGYIKARLVYQQYKEGGQD